MRARIARHCYLAAGAAATVAATAGCGAILDAAAPSRAAPAPVTLTAPAAPSMLVAVTGPGGMSTLIRQVITATARPREDLDVLTAGQRGRAAHRLYLAVPGPGDRPGPAHGPGPGGECLPAEPVPARRDGLARRRSRRAGARSRPARRPPSRAGSIRCGCRWPSPAPGRRIATSLPGDCSIAANADHRSGEPGWFTFRRAGRAAVRRESQRPARPRANWTGTMSSP